MKQNIKTFLAARDYDAVVTLCVQERRAWKSLRACLYESDDEVKWPAIEAIGRLMKHWWDNSHRKKVQEYVRSLFWLLNDESGGIGWTSPQQIAEIICLIPDLDESYGTMVIDRTLEEPPLVPGGLWAIGRQGRRLEGRIGNFEKIILNCFNNTDSQTLGLAAWAVGESRFTPALPHLTRLKDHPETVRIFIDGRFVEKLLVEWADLAVSNLNAE